jgi:hypothetical protein
VSIASFGRAQGQRGTGHELPGEPGCGAVHVSVRYDLVHQADPQGFLSVHEPSGVDEVLGPGRPDQPGQPLGAAQAWDDAEQDLGHAKPDAFAGDPEVRA